MLPKIMVPLVRTRTSSGTRTVTLPNRAPTCTASWVPATCTSRLPNTEAPSSAVSTDPPP